jgi:outer membrane protein assembly factor BamB
MMGRLMRTAAIATVMPLLTLAIAAQDNPPNGPAVLWKLRGEGHGPPLAGHGRAYVLSAQHELIALEGSSGKILWRSPTEKGTGATKGSAVVSCGRQVIAGDNTLVAFDADSGERTWRFTPPVGYGAGYYLGSPHGDTVFAGSPAARVYAVTCTSGALAWSTSISDQPKTTVFEPVADDEVVVAGYTTFSEPSVGGVVALARDTGRVLWRFAFPHQDNPALATGATGGPVIAGPLVIASSANGIVHALDRMSGAERWIIPALDKVADAAPADPDKDFRALAVSGRLLIVGSLTGRLTAYDLESRKLQWTYRSASRGGIGFRIRVVGSHVYVPYVDGVIHSISVETGREEWTFGTWQDGFLWPPAVDDRFLYLSGAAAGFYGLKLPSAARH